MHDVVIRNGTVVDGTGSPRFAGDVAISDGVIREVGAVSGTGRRELDADGLLVTPGWVDIHTHYDGQATWDPLLAPSSDHGVTTVVMGNCGVGFAPVRPGTEDWLVGLMEGVEDIPGSALAEGINWNWESFPEYLNVLDGQARALNIAAQIPHGALRAYVMGERGGRNEPATDADIAAMRRLVEEAVKAGALGVSTSRTIAHRAVDGEPVPGTFAAVAELRALAAGLVDAGRGVFEVAPAGVVGEDLLAPEREVAWMSQLSRELGVPITFLLQQHNKAPEQWRRTLELVDAANASGATLVPQVAPRPIMMLVGHQCRLHPFSARPAYSELEHLPLAERVTRLRDHEIRRRILAEEDPPDSVSRQIAMIPEKMFLLGDPPDYEPGPECSVAALAAARGQDPWECLYDLMLNDGGRELIMKPALNYSYGNLDAACTMMLHPSSVIGGSDGGAHYSAICDASMPTSLLTHWARDRTAGPKLSIERVVQMQTSRTAQLYGIDDRGVLAPGKIADVNLIDHEHLRLSRPVMAFDLPAGARRLLQRAEGYIATIVSGEVAFEHGEHTGVLAGHLVRSGSPSAHAA
jgi:N-acyl-D-amino-acid deacylase